MRVRSVVAHSARVSLATLAVAIAGIAAASSVAAQSPLPYPIASAGQTVPGFPAGAKFKSFLGPRIDALGRTVFYGLATGGGVTSASDQGIFRQFGTGLQLLAREGDVAPFTSGAKYINLATGIGIDPPSIALNASGALAFMTRLTGGDVCDCDSNGVLDNDSAVYREGAGLELVARAGSPVPGLAGVVFDTIVTPPFLADDGTFVGFFGLRGAGVTTSNDSAILVAAAGAPLSVRVREGDPMPGFPPGTAIGTLGRPFLGSSGDFSFTAKLVGPGVTTRQDDVLLAWRDGGIQLVARQEEVLPSGDVLGMDAVDGVFLNHSVQGGDRMAFTALLDDGGTALLREYGGELVEVVRSGALAPGLSGVHFASFGVFAADGPLQLGADGRLVFMARLDTLLPNNESLWRADADLTLHLIARSGDPSPGGIPGTTFGDDSAGSNPVFSPPAVDADGRVAFTARLKGQGLGSIARGLFVTNLAGHPGKLVQSNEVYAVAGATITVRGVDFNKDAQDKETYDGPVFTDDGTLAFRMSFIEGGEGVFEFDIDGAFSSLGGGLAGVAGIPSLVGSGALVGHASGALDLSGAAPLRPALLMIGLGSQTAPFKGGTLLALPVVGQFMFATDAAGAWHEPFQTPDGLAAGIAFTLQVLVLDAAAVQGVALSNGVALTTP